jgi:hypothetical protein
VGVSTRWVVLVPATNALVVWALLVACGCTGISASPLGQGFGISVVLLRVLFSQEILGVYYVECMFLD